MESLQNLKNYMITFFEYRNWRIKFATQQNK